jgi:polysaccharide deacetylase 2 family uncharacterized protein YibQ
MAATDIVPEEVTMRSRRGTHVLALGSTGLILTVLLLAGGVEWLGQASDGEPLVLLTLPGAPPTAELAQDQRPVPTVPQPLMQPVAPPKIMQPIYAGAALVADPALIDNTAVGPLPRIADNGRTPMQAYAPPVAAAGKPRIAVVMSGLGIGAKSTAAALEQLPPAVTMAFVAAAANLQQWVSEARRRGHEALLQVPMEPYDYPDSDPGPNTMRVGLRQDENMERLTWAATRTTGYAGLMNLAGSRLMADADSFVPVLTFAARRGLMFFEFDPAARSIGAQLAAQTRTAYVRSATAIDAEPDAADIDRQLSDLETNARANGSAAATASAYPITLAHIKTWAQGLSGRGFVLVPASAIVAPAR